jgi:hypothetical protein
LAVVAGYGPKVFLMSRVRLVHWKAEDAEEKMELLRNAGHQVMYGGDHKEWRQTPCDVFVIDLSRLPSHGREVAIFLRGSKATRNIPIIFVDGAPEKVDAIRKQLPDALYTSWSRIRSSLRKLPRVECPIVPTQMMDRFASRTTAQKLGIKEKTSVTVVDPPRDYLQVLGALPESVQVEEDADAIAVTICFVRDPEALPDLLSLGRRIAARTKFWICWPKGKKSAIGEQYIRDSAIALGLVDYKVCSVNVTWSGLLFALKKDG